MSSLVGPRPQRATELPVPTPSGLCHPGAVSLLMGGSAWGWGGPAWERESGGLVALLPAVATLCRATERTPVCHQVLGCIPLLLLVTLQGMSSTLALRDVSGLGAHLNATSTAVWQVV